MIHHVFIFGVVIPTLITVVLFIGFLICWFKFNMRERLFKKAIRKKKIKKSIVQQNGIVSAHNVIQYSPKDDLDSQRSNDQDDDGDDSMTGTSSASVPPAKNYENMEEGCLGEDPETALCAESRPVDLQGITNPNLCSSPTEPNGGVTVTKQEFGSVVQHTFHFPPSDCNTLSSVGVDSEDGSEDGNYGHFVPLSQLLQEAKNKQFLAKQDMSCRAKHKDCSASQIMRTNDRYFVAGV